MAELGGLTPEQQSRIGAMLSWYENVGRYLGGAGQRAQPVRMDSQVTLCKASSTISASCSGSVEMWRSTAVSTEAETAQGTTFTAYDWFGSGASTGDKLFAFRETRSGRYYFLKPGGGTFGWYGRGQFVSPGTVGATGNFCEFDTTAIPNSTYAPAGISMSTDHTEITFTSGGWYHIDWSFEVQITNSGATGVACETVQGICYRSTGTTNFLSITESRIRFSVLTGIPISGADTTPEGRGTEAFLLNVNEGHKVRFRISKIGASTTTITGQNSQVCILKLANTETYSSTS